MFLAEIEINKALDLDCIKIEIDNNISEGVYVNSVASLNKNNLLANANGVVSHEVYWSFEGDIKLDHKSLAKTNLLFSKNFELECISEAIDPNGLYR